MLTGSQLAEHLGVSKGRVSQYLSEGKLDGCFTGDGRARRFDLVKVCTALGRKLDFGQMLGNGAQTRKAIVAITAGDVEEATPPVANRPKSNAPSDGAELPIGDAGRYELARAQKVEEEARRLRRQNLTDEGTYVLASEVDRQVAKVMAQEIAEFESVLRAGARDVADRLGVDFKSARQILIDVWRKHRADRSGQLEAQSDGLDMTDAEIGADV